MYDRRILSTAFGKGSEHDFSIFKRTFDWVHADVCILGDSGFQGIHKLHKNSWIPHKSTKYNPLSASKKFSNKCLSSHRICVEHVIRYLKRFKILSSRYRNKRKRHSLRVSLLAGLCNSIFG